MGCNGFDAMARRQGCASGSNGRGAPVSAELAPLHPLHPLHPVMVAHECKNLALTATMPYTPSYGEQGGGVGPPPASGGRHPSLLCGHIFAPIQLLPGTAYSRASLPSANVGLLACMTGSGSNGSMYTPMLRAAVCNEVIRVSRGRTSLMQLLPGCGTSKTNCPWLCARLCVHQHAPRQHPRLPPTNLGHMGPVSSVL